MEVREVYYLEFKRYWLNEDWIGWNDGCSSTASNKTSGEGKYVCSWCNY